MMLSKKTKKKGSPLATHGSLTLNNISFLLYWYRQSFGNKNVLLVYYLLIIVNDDDF